MRGEIPVVQTGQRRTAERLAALTCSTVTGGAQIETSFPLQLGSLRDLRLALGATSIVVKGRVAHARVTDVEQQQVVYESGIEFVEPAEQVRAAIDAFVTELRATQGN